MSSSVFGGSSGSLTAHVFNQRVIEDSFKDNFYKVLLRDFDTHFFSHLHDIPLVAMTKVDTISHFYDFFKYLCRGYEGRDIAHCYQYYYVNFNYNREILIKQFPMPRN